MPKVAISDPLLAHFLGMPTPAPLVPYAGLPMQYHVQNLKDPRSFWGRRSLALLADPDELCGHILGAGAVPHLVYNVLPSDNAGIRQDGIDALACVHPKKIGAVAVCALWEIARFEQLKMLRDRAYEVITKKFSSSDHPTQEQCAERWAKEGMIVFDAHANHHKGNPRKNPREVFFM
jgi:hypothetical protein